MKPKMIFTRAGGFFAFLAISLVGNFYFMLRQLPMDFGGGRYEASPNKRFVAHANSLRDVGLFAPDSRVFGELSVCSTGHDAQPIVAIIIRPERVADEMDYRDLDKLIQWSEDSSSVTFSTPSGEFRVRVPDSD